MQSFKLNSESDFSKQETLADKYQKIKNLLSLTPATLRAPLDIYFFAVLMVLTASALGFLIHPHHALHNLMMVYLLAVVIIAMRGYLIPALLGSVLSVVSYDYFFVPPQFSFVVTDPEFVITLVVMFLISLIISYLTLLTHQQVALTLLRERRLSALHTLSLRLASNRGLERLIDIAVHYLAEVFDSAVLIFLPDANGQLQIQAAQPSQYDAPSEQEMMWIIEAYQHHRILSHDKEKQLPEGTLFIPLRGSEKCIGVIRIISHQPAKLCIAEQLRLLEACANQIAMALEVDRLQEIARQHQVEIETERLRSALLSSVSHDLRTPLAAIMGSAASLLQMPHLDTSIGRELLQNIFDESERLNRLINNLLQTVRLESGKIQVHKEWCVLEEIIGAVLNRLEKALGTRPVKINLPEDMPMVPLDHVLMEQVLINLIDNAIRYTIADTPIEIGADFNDKEVIIKIADKGSGIAENDLKKIFEKFYRGQSAGRQTGAGLGLAICQGIIQAHGGHIWAENRVSGGAKFYIRLTLTK